MDVGVESKLVLLRIDKNVGYSFSLCLLFILFCTSSKRLKRLIRPPHTLPHVFTGTGQKQRLLKGLLEDFFMRLNAVD